MAELEMDLVGHLTELRKRVLICFFSWLAMSLLFFFFSERVLDILAQPVGTLVILTPAEAFSSQLKLAGFLGLLSVFPFFAYQGVAFAWPALERSEKIFFSWLVTCSVLLFYLGLLFGYKLLFPEALHFLLGFSSRQRELSIGLANYVSFFLQVVFPCGLVFQFPLIITGLTKLGIIDSQLLKKGRKYAVLVIAIVAAVLTPPDFFSQLLLGLPLLFLYEISIGLANFIDKGKKAELSDHSHRSEL